jgi:hypothetical protein
MNQSFGGWRFLRHKLRDINIHVAMHSLFLGVPRSPAQHDFPPLLPCVPVPDL